MTWNQLIKQHGPESGSFLQTTDWGAFQASIGRTIFYIASLDGQVKLLESVEVKQVININGLALAILMPISFGKKFLYIPRGPIGENAEQIIKLATKIAQEQQAIFIKIDPSALFELRRTGPTLLTTHYSLLTKPSFSLQPEQTVILDLTKDAKELLAAMHTKTRYNIALARRHGITIKRLDPSSLPQDDATGLPRSPGLARNDMFNQWFDLVTATARRDDFHAHTKEYYKKLLEINGDFKTTLWLAFDGDDLLAGNLTGYFNNTVTYLHGASSDTKRNLMAPFLLHWEIILDAQKNGYNAYDFWGIDPKKWPGITRFKQNFGNESTLHEVTYPKTIDISINRFWHGLYKLKKIFRH